MKKKCFAIILSALLLSSLAVSAFADPPAAPPGGFGESGGPGGQGGSGGPGKTLTRAEISKIIYLLMKPD